MPELVTSTPVGSGGLVGFLCCGRRFLVETPNSVEIKLSLEMGVRCSEGPSLLIMKTFLIVYDGSEALT